MAAVALDLIVFGRGVLAGPDGFALTPASVARVEAAVAYVARHEPEFRAAAPRPRIVFTGGWAGTSDADPPVGQREGDLMLRLAADAGLARWAELRTETRSRSTLENLVHTAEDGLLTGRRPLGLVSHSWHLPRVRHLAGRVLGLRGPELLDIPVTGFSAAGVLLHLATRVGGLGTRDPARLLRRERRVRASLRRLRGIRAACPR